MISFYLSLLDTPEEKNMFEQLYRLYRQDMYKMAYGILKNKYDTEDAVHEAFMRVMKNLTKISEIDCPQTHAYLLIIVRNVSLSIIKKRTKTVVVDTDTVEITDDFGLEEYVISNMEVERLKNILEQLSDEYYEVLFLELFMEFNISEIAEQLGLTYDNTKKRIQRAKRNSEKLQRRRKMSNNLYRAFEETAVSRIIEKVPQMPDHKFSRRFERKMKKLIRYGYRELVRYHKVTVKRLFICITAALIAAVVMALSVGAVRDFFKNFFMEVFGTHTTVQTFSDNINAPASIEDVYMIDVPNGFDIIYEDEIFEWSTFICYEYSKDDYYIFFNQYVKSKYDVNINTEDRPLNYIEINGNDGYIVDLGNNEYYISWDNGDYIFDIIGNISKDELIETANSVQKVE